MVYLVIMRCFESAYFNNTNLVCSTQEFSLQKKEPFNTEWLLSFFLFFIRYSYKVYVILQIPIKPITGEPTKYCCFLLYKLESESVIL